MEGNNTQLIPYNQKSENSFNEDNDIIKKLNDNELNETNNTFLNYKNLIDFNDSNFEPMNKKLRAIKRHNRHNRIIHHFTRKYGNDFVLNDYTRRTENKNVRSDKSSNLSEEINTSRTNNYRLSPFVNDKINVALIPYKQKIIEINSMLEHMKTSKYKSILINSPDILHKWVRLIFNIIITSSMLTIIYFIFISVREDISKKIIIQQQNIKQDSLLCKKQYETHKCGTVNLPLLSEKCDEWLRCMKADSNLYQDISFLSAQMLGQIVNAFIVQFEWKSIFVIAFIFLLIFIGSNYALTLGANNSNYNFRNNTNDYPVYSQGINSYPHYEFIPNNYSMNTFMNYRQPYGYLNDLNTFNPYYDDDYYINDNFKKKVNLSNKEKYRNLNENENENENENIRNEINKNESSGKGFFYKLFSRKIKRNLSNS